MEESTHYADKALPDMSDNHTQTMLAVFQSSRLRYSQQPTAPSFPRNFSNLMWEGHPYQPPALPNRPTASPNASPLAPENHALCPKSGKLRFLQQNPTAHHPTTTNQSSLFTSNTSHITTPAHPPLIQYTAANSPPSFQKQNQKTQGFQPLRHSPRAYANSDAHSAHTSKDTPLLP